MDREASMVIARTLAAVGFLHPAGTVRQRHTIGILV